jgi:hypothetical protein
MEKLGTKITLYHKKLSFLFSGYSLLASGVEKPDHQTVLMRQDRAAKETGT